MKRIICILLAVSLLLSVAVPSFAAESEEPWFGSINVEYSDSYGSIEQLEVMVQDGHVYANAETLSSRLGYHCEYDETSLSIYSYGDLFQEGALCLSLYFSFNDETVSYNPLIGVECRYTAPAPCIQNERGVWVPLRYTLVLLGGNSTLLGDVLLIQMPCNNVLSVASIISHNQSILSFDWEDDFGYSESTSKRTDGASRIVTLFSGLLELDGDAWLSLIDWSAFDKKFGESLAMMFCTNSAEELQASIGQVETLLDVFDPDGTVGDMLRNKQLRMDSDVTVWKTACEEYLELLEDGSGSPTKYNLLYQQYERAMDDQSLFAALGGEGVIHIQNELSSATNVLDIAFKIGSAVSYISEFQEKDAYQISVLKNYLSTRSQTDKMPEATAEAMLKYISSTDSAGQYVFSRFLEEHALELIVDKSGLDAYLGAPANILLFAWDIMSETIPFYSDGLGAVENREISNYAQKMQNDALENVNILLSELKNNTFKISAEDCVQLSEYCYIYLKACYIARSAAIKSLDNTSDEFRDQIQGTLDTETNVNQQIAKYLSVLNSADIDNTCYILGFLPENNNEYLNTCSDDDLLSIVKENRILEQPLVSDAFSDTVSYEYATEGFLCYHIPQVELEGDLAEDFNKQIYNELYQILERDVYDSMEENGIPMISLMHYTWSQRSTVASIIVKTSSMLTGDASYRVYNISTETGKEATPSDFLQAFDLSEAEYIDMVKRAIRDFFAESPVSRQISEDALDKLVEDSLSEVSVDTTSPFVNADGDLCAKVGVYWPAGSGWYTQMLNLTGTSNVTVALCELNRESHNANNVVKQPSVDYSAVIEQYRTALATDYATCGDYVSDDLEWIAHAGGSHDIYYAQKDLNGDGIDELIIGGWDDYHEEMILFSIFGLDGQSPVLLEGNSSYGHRAELHIFVDGTFMNWGSGGANTSSYTYYYIEDGSCNAVVSESFGTMMGEPYYRDALGNETSISMDELRRLWDREDPAEMEFEWTRISSEG